MRRFSQFLAAVVICVSVGAGAASATSGKTTVHCADPNKENPSWTPPPGTQLADCVEWQLCANSKGTKCIDNDCLDPSNPSGTDCLGTTLYARKDLCSEPHSSSCAHTLSHHFSLTLTPLPRSPHPTSRASFLPPTRPIVQRTFQQRTYGPDPSRGPQTDDWIGLTVSAHMTPQPPFLLRLAARA